MQAHKLPDYARLRAILHSSSSEPAPQPGCCPAALHYVDAVKSVKAVTGTPPRKRMPSAAAADPEEGAAGEAAAVAQEAADVAQPPRKRYKATTAADAAHWLQAEE